MAFELKSALRGGKCDRHKVCHSSITFGELEMPLGTVSSSVFLGGELHTISLLTL